MPRRASKTSSAEEGELTPASLAAELADEFGEDKVRQGELPKERGYLSTQCAILDFAIGRPGIPTGAMTNIYGPEGSGKSTLAYHIIAETQRRGGFAALYDSEGAYDMDRATRCGVKHNDLIFFTAPTLEEFFDEAEAMIKKVSVRNPDALITIVVDSFAAAPAAVMLEGKYGESHPAAQARVISQSLPRLVPQLWGTNTAFICIGQNRAKLSIGPSWGGPKETQIGEGSIRYYSHLRIELAEAGEEGPKGEATGIRVRAYTKKNKTGPPKRTVHYVVNFWDGIDNVAAKFDVATRVGLVSGGAGGWYRYGEEKFQSKDWSKFLEAHAELGDLIAAAPLLWMQEELPA